MSRRRLLTGGALGAAGLAAVYAGEVERHWIEFTEVAIKLRGLPGAFEGLRVAQISDIHMDEFTEPSYLKHAVARVNALRPEMVLLTGDFVSEGPMGIRFAKGAAWQCAEILKGLDCQRVFAVLGNHDVSVDAGTVDEALRANGVRMLTNRALPFEKDGQRMWLAGLDDPLLGRPKPDLAVPERIRQVAGEPVILLCHAPDYVDELRASAAGEAIDLVLSGHTHGGQVRLPFYGPLTLPDLGKKYVHGLFRVGPMQLYVNRGLGTVGVPFRFDCPPEVTMLTLTRA